MVVMPLAFEQSAIAARLEHAGVARVLGRRDVRLGGWPAAIDEVRPGPASASAPRRCGSRSAAAGGVRRAADLIEAALT